MTAATFPEIRRMPHPLPNDITLEILARSISSPACGLALLCPEWCLCGHPDPHLETILRTSRIDTYTIPLHPPTARGPHGTISTTFSHTNCDAFLLPFMDDPRDAYDIATTSSTHHNPNDNPWQPEDPRQVYANPPTPNEHAHKEPSWLSHDLQRLLVQRWISNYAVVTSQRSEPRQLNPGWENFPTAVIDRLVLLRTDAALRLLPYDDDILVVEPILGGREEGEEAMVEGGKRKREKGEGEGEGKGGEYSRTKRLRATDHTEKDVLPFSADEEDFLFKRIRHLVVRGEPSLTRADVGHIADGIWTAARLDPWVEKMKECLQQTLDYERAAHLWVRWDKMERLESLFLDLRGYSTFPRTLVDKDVADIATRLSKKPLKLLVIAGLRSWRFYPGFDPVTMEEVVIGEKDPEFRLWRTLGSGTDINVFKTFRGAVRPGGRLVFVDTAQEEKWMYTRPEDTPSAPLVD